MRNIWLLIPGLEEHELDGCNMKFEVGAFIPMADSDTDERLRLRVDVPGVVGTDGIGREGRLEITPVEYECFDKPEPEWWISGSESTDSLERKYLGCKQRLLKV